MRVIGIDLGQNLGVAVCDDGRITHAGLLVGPTATQQLCGALRSFINAPAICWERSLWLPGRRSAFQLVERQRGAILEALGSVHVLEVAPQQPRAALLGDGNASDARILEWVLQAGLFYVLPKKKRWTDLSDELAAVHRTKAAHVCDAILLALYGHSRLAWMQRARAALLGDGNASDE